MGDRVKRVRPFDRPLSCHCLAIRVRKVLKGIEGNLNCVSPIDSRLG